MKNITRLTLSVALLLATIACTAQYHLYIKAIASDGSQIEGESVVKGHEKEIEAHSFGQDISNCCGDVASKLTIGKFIVNIQLGKASNILRGILMKGTHMKSVFITAVKAGDKPVDFYKITMEEVFVSQITDGQPDLTTLPQQQVSFNANRIGWAYFPQKPDGTTGDPVKFGWDVKKMAEWSGF
ncbi:Hcp family type VI secretion system effector [Foetidibacter luteolus]|uniref:Hcp family type VI secretion system effector n=1 Tax=Foetidibacter luteolus TaxID=2608880 RepID=UPI00129A527B|nr:type VI secretion system tube protein Hcp [Foetidibacter luteolus]